VPCQALLRRLFILFKFYRDNTTFDKKNTVI